MNQHTLFIEMNATSDVLERILRVTRHRGFFIKKMDMQHDGDYSKMAVTVSSERPIAHLIHQLNKLFDVLACQLQEQVAQSTTALAANG